MTMCDKCLKLQVAQGSLPFHVHNAPYCKANATIASSEDWTGLKTNRSSPSWRDISPSAPDIVSRSWQPSDLSRIARSSTGSGVRLSLGMLVSSQPAAAALASAGIQEASAAVAGPIRSGQPGICHQAGALVMSRQGSRGGWKEKALSGWNRERLGEKLRTAAAGSSAEGSSRRRFLMAECSAARLLFSMARAAISAATATA